MMPIWRVCILITGALIIGFGIGYAAWGRPAAALEAQVFTLQATARQVLRERDACNAGGRVGEQLWEGRGIVRAVYPRLVVITHEDIDELLPARTTGFQWLDGTVRTDLGVGDPVRFWLLGAGLDTSVLKRIEPW